MPYLICEECNIYYEIEADFNLKDLENCGECGKKLKYYETIDEYYNESYENHIEDNEDDYSPKNYNTHHQEKNTDINYNETHQNTILNNKEHDEPQNNEKKDYQEIDEYYKDSYRNQIIDNKENYYPSSKESHHYNLIAISGIIIALLGLGILIFAYISPFLFLSQNINNLNSASSFNDIMSGFTQIVIVYVVAFILIATGVIIYIFSKSKNHKQKKSVGKIKKRSNFINKLPEGYFILNKVKIPLKNINFNHIVIGPTGIFLIKIKKLNGNIIVNENELLSEKGNNRRIAGNPGRKLKTETIELSRFLSSRGLDVSHLKISTILAFSNDNFQIEKVPSFYDVLKLEEIDDFIVNSRRKMDETDVIEAMVLLEPYCKEALKT